MAAADAKEVRRHAAGRADRAISSEMRIKSGRVYSRAAFGNVYISIYVKNLPFWIGKRGR